MNLFKKLISQQRDQTELPEDLGWDSMSVGIYEKFSELEANRPQSKSKINQKITWLLLLLLLIGGIWSCNNWLNLRTPVEDSSDESVEYAHEDSPIPAITILNHEESIAASPTQDISIVTTDVNHSLQTNMNESREWTMASTTQNVNGGSSLDIDVINQKEQSSLAVSYDHEHGPEEIEGATETTRRLLASRLWTRPILPLLADHDNHLMSSVSALALHVDVSEIDKLQHRWLLSMYSGTAQTIPKNQVISDTPTLMISESSLASLSLGLGASFRLTKSLFVEGLVNWTQYYTQYNLVKISSSSITVDNQKIEIRTNPLTGRSRSIYGSVPTKLVETRELRKYNSVDLLSLHFRMGWEAQFNKLNTRLYVSMVASRAINADGKAYISQEIVEYDRFQDRYHPTTHLGLGSGLRVSYDLSPAINFGLDFGYNHYLSQGSSLDVQRFDPSNIAGSISLGYRL